MHSRRSGFSGSVRRREQNGEMQYTEDLLTYPPSGVEYVSMIDAPERGELVDEASWRSGGARPHSPALAALRVEPGSVR